MFTPLECVSHGFRIVVHHKEAVTRPAEPSETTVLMNWPCPGLMCVLLVLRPPSPPCRRRRCCRQRREGAGAWEGARQGTAGEGERKGKRKGAAREGAGTRTGERTGNARERAGKSEWVYSRGWGKYFLLYKRQINTLQWGKDSLFLYCPLGVPEQPGRPVSRGYLHSPSPSLRTQDVVVQQRPSIFQGKSVITSLMYALCVYTHVKFVLFSWSATDPDM